MNYPLGTIEKSDADARRDWLRQVDSARCGPGRLDGWRDDLDVCDGWLFKTLEAGAMFRRFHMCNGLDRRHRRRGSHGSTGELRNPHDGP